MFFRMLGVVIGGCLIASAAEATPQHDHELLVELASLELTRCQDELTKLRDFQSDNSEMKVMAVRAAAIAEAECKKLRDAIDAAGTIDANSPDRNQLRARNADTSDHRARDQRTSGQKKRVEKAVGNADTGDHRARHQGTSDHKKRVQIAEAAQSNVNRSAGARKLHGDR
jgi:hypothetical protein